MQFKNTANIFHILITITFLTANTASSSVAEKALIRSTGMSEMKPTVSINTAVMRFGSTPACAVTSSVANSWSLGVRLASPVSAFIRVVFPEI